MTGTGPAGPLVMRTHLRLRPDTSRTLSRLFVPGQETLIRGESRAMAVINRVLAMSEDQVHKTLDRALARFSDQYRDLGDALERNFGLVAHRLGNEITMGRARRRLIGAYFTQQYALEAAALFNPSIVQHPDQAGCATGEVRFVMSLRAIGEGHLSSIEFRTGTISADFGARGDRETSHREASDRETSDRETSDRETSDCGISIDPAGPFPDIGRSRATAYDRNLFQEKLAELGHQEENAQFLWSLLPPRFSLAELDAAVAELSLQQVMRGDCVALVDLVRWMAASNYEVEFDADHSISERVLWPSGPAESHGMEDARFVRFTGDDDPVYFATYTAFDGRRVASHLLQTADFRTFTVSQLAGQAAKNKGMALFPRRIGGKYAALSRWDRESNGIAYSGDASRWGEAVTVQAPARPWELVQLGNCGSPIETTAGWLVFTHGVGPMREYSIGAVLLDLDEPGRLIAALPEPLLVPSESERQGYVPNVVYSCGSLLHGDAVVLPYGCSDSSVRFAIVDLPQLLDRLTRA